MPAIFITADPNNTKSLIRTNCAANCHIGIGAIRGYAARQLQQTAPPPSKSAHYNAPVETASL